MHEENAYDPDAFYGHESPGDYIFLKYNIWAAQRPMHAFKKVPRTFRLLVTNEGIKMQPVHDDMMQMQKKTITRRCTQHGNIHKSSYGKSIHDI